MTTRIIENGVARIVPDTAYHPDGTGARDSDGTRIGGVEKADSATRSTTARRPRGPAKAADASAPSAGGQAATTADSAE